MFNDLSETVATNFKRYEKQETEMQDAYMQLKLFEQSTSEKNIQLEQQVAQLDANVDKLRYQLRQKKHARSKSEEDLLSSEEGYKGF